MNYPENDKTQQKYLQAKERVEELKKFYNNLTSYIVIITLLGIFNYSIDKWENPWFLWAAFGWGIGVVFHAIKAFRINPLFDKNWEEQKIRKYMEEEEENNHNKQLWE